MADINDILWAIQDALGGGSNISVSNRLPVDALSTAPVAKAAIFNTALPAAEAGWLATAITPTSSPSFLRIFVSVTVAGILRVARTIGAATVVDNLNNGVPLVASALCAFDIEWRTGDSINFRYSVTGGTINVLRVDEVLEV